MKSENSHGPTNSAALAPLQTGKAPPKNKANSMKSGVNGRYRSLFNQARSPCCTSTCHSSTNINARSKKWTKWKPWVSLTMLDECNSSRARSNHL